MKKLSIIVAAALLTFSVSDGAHARCNTNPGTAGIAGLVTAEASEDNPSNTQAAINITAQVFRNRFVNTGSGDQGERTSGGIVVCEFQETEDPPDTDPKPPAGFSAN